MSCSLPPEIQDLIIDHLRDEPTTLKACCLVTKSWIHRTRKHLFAVVEFTTFRPDFRRWKVTFPDPAKSPAHHTRTLSILHFVTAADADIIASFCGVVRLNVDISGYDRGVSLVPLHGFSPVIRSLRLVFTRLPNSNVFGLICSFPLLEDLVLVSPRLCSQRGGERWSTPVSSPRFTGSLELHMFRGIQPTTKLLLDLPNGLHFTRIATFSRFRCVYDGLLESGGG